MPTSYAVQVVMGAPQRNSAPPCPKLNAMRMQDQTRGNWGAAKRFRLVLREQGNAREMGGDDMSLAVGIVDNIFMNAIDMGCSDIHLQPERDQLSIRFRQDGVLHSSGQLPPEQATNVLARLKLAAGMRIDEYRESQDGRIDMEYDGRRLSARASCVPCLNGEKFVMRLLDPAAMRVELSRLGMPEGILRDWSRAIQVPYGLILVTGPTGSGKTSTLYASLQQLDANTRNIVTVEDPIEYEFDRNIAQVQVTEKMPFARTMRSFLRQDPDVMMVGEIRDPESLAIAIQAALTGHLVLSTLHTNNAVEAINRMVDMGAERYLIAGVVVAIMAQRLVRLNAPNRVPAQFPEHELRDLGVTEEMKAGAQFMVGKPEEGSTGSGYKGRLGIFELMLGTPQLRDAIARGASMLELEQVARQNGYRSMLEDGREKVLRGWTTPEEVLRAVHTASVD